MSTTILFDFDGVLVDSIEIFSEAVNVAGRKLKQPVAFVPDDLRNIKRMSIPEIVEAANVDPNLSKEFIVEIERALYDRYEQIQLFPEMAKVVQQLREVSKLGIGSATSVAVVQRVLEHQGIKQLFDDIVGGDVP
ncbi:MAG: HAD family hydrolase, partial [Gammaproteobacteria bacterium]|nr:HAD family hydrolase [Gammaproteobacteria bacterium]